MLLLFVALPKLFVTGSSGTVKVFVLAGQSNMEGKGEVATLNTSTGAPLNGTLLYQLLDPRTSKDFSVLWDSSTGSWKTLHNVKLWFNEAAHAQGINGSLIPGTAGVDYAAGNLTVGFGYDGNKRKDNFNLFGPELGFGFEFNAAHQDTTVLIIKVAWGGKSLAVDFRPPSSTYNADPYCQPPKCESNVTGHFYKVMVQTVKEILMNQGVNIGKMFPDLEGRTPELSGFGWFQGWNDRIYANRTAAYETNLVNLIKDLRREWNAPRLPISIAVSGFGGYNMRDDDIIRSQFGAANLTRHPELECCVVACETRGFWREAQYSPNEQEGYHFNHNAETYFLIGKAIARGMMQAIGIQ